ncbi:MAG: caspase family protein [Bacteroidales bacterium]|nr:caspase family protein [Bacteroidales bacterium]
MMIKRRFIFILIIALSFVSVHSQLRQYSGEKRHALIIGNSDYAIGVLTNPVNDAYAMAMALEELGFDVSLRLEVKTKDEMKRAIREFGDKLKQGGVGLFYFAGHGLQVGGFNFLVPIHAQIDSEEEVEYESVDVGFVLAQMEAAQNQMNIVILDACRNNPYARSFRSSVRGLASISAPTGSLIAYSTAPGATASDGIGKNGLYTGELLKQIQLEGLKIEEVFKNVRANVLAKSGGRQVPWESSSLIGDFYFVSESSSSLATPLAEQNQSHGINVESNASRSEKQVPQQKETTTLLNSVMEDTESLLSPGTNESGMEMDAKWKSNGTEYWLYFNGREISKQTTNRWAENAKDLEVYHPESNTTFILSDFSYNTDNRLHEAEIRLNNGFKKTLPLWKANADDGYWLFVDGIDISRETTYEWSDKDLKVYHKATKTYYLLKDYNKNLDNTLRPAEIIK